MSDSSSNTPPRTGRRAVSPASETADTKVGPITIYPTPAQYAALVELSRATRVPMAVYIREGLDLLLESALCLCRSIGSAECPVHAPKKSEADAGRDVVPPVPEET